MRRHFFFTDLAILGWLGLLFLMTLTGAIFGDGERTAALLGTLVPLALVYFVLQRFAMHVHPKWQRGEKLPQWLNFVMVLALLSPILLMPATFLSIGHALEANDLVPSITQHEDFDPSADYDPDHADGAGFDLGPHGGATSWDIRLKEADIALFGVYPPQAMRAWHRPWLSGLMQLCYLFYYFAPLLAGIPLLFQKRWREFRVATALVAGCLILTYLLYFFFPSTGPRFEGGIEAWLPAEPGWFGAETIYRAIDAAESFRWDAFPSGHVAVSLVSLFVTLRFNRRLGFAMILPVLGLCMATIYMGYHYGIDVLGGLACALICAFGLPPLVAKWEAKLWVRDIGIPPESV